MTALPEAALPVVEILRRDVKRPEDEPVVEQSVVHGVPRWKRPQHPSLACCPIGLHKAFLWCGAPEPREAGEKLGVGFAAALSFVKWWDSLAEEEARQAVDLIWPREGTT